MKQLTFEEAEEQLFSLMRTCNREQLETALCISVLSRLNLLTASRRATKFLSENNLERVSEELKFMTLVSNTLYMVSTSANNMKSNICHATLDGCFRMIEEFLSRKEKV